MDSSLVALCLLLSVAAADAEPAVAPPRTVLVELFTSEGCSSCPPADAYLAQLQRVQPLRGVEIITLSQHVDYWDDLGWKDPYSDPEFTRRQRSYARALGSGVYTPQLVVDGSAELVGGRRGDALVAIRRAAERPQARLTLKRINDEGSGAIALEVRVSDTPPIAAGELVEVWLAVVEDGLESEVTSGENAGRALRHDGVVRELRRLGVLAAGAEARIDARVEVLANWKPERLRVAVFVQEREGRRVLGAAGLRLSPQ